MPVDTDTILTAAGVSAVVTIAIEYAAKPHLEARKERILATHRGWRELQAALMSMQAGLAKLMSMEGAPAAQAQAVEDAAWKELQAADREIMRLYFELALGLPAEARTMVQTISTTLANAVQTRTIHRSMRFDGELSEAVGRSQDILDRNRSYFFRQLARRRARSWIRERMDSPSASS